MINIKKVLSVIALPSLILTSGCVFNDTGKNEQAVEIVAMSAVSQAVYSSLVQKPELIGVYQQLMIVLNTIDGSVDMTPEEISKHASDALAGIYNGDYSFIVGGIIESLFVKYNIGWNDKIDKEKIHGYIADIIIAIDVAIEEYDNRV